MRAALPPVRTLIAAATAAACLVTFAAPARAQWPQGVLGPEYFIQRHSTSEFYLAHGPDPSKTWCVTVERGGAAQFPDIFGFTTQGSGTPQLLPYNQLPSATPPGAQITGQIVVGKPFAPDAGGGGFYFYASPSNGGNFVSLYALRYDATGSVLPTSTRVDSGHTARTSPKLATLTTPDSGAWCVWGSSQARLVRVDHNGALVPPFALGGWLVPGMSNGSARTGAALAPDGAGGILIAATNPSVRVQRISSDTTIAAGWPATGLSLSAPTVVGTNFLYLDPGALVRADASAFFLLYTDASTAPFHLKVNRFLLSGVRDPNWPEAGIMLPSVNPALQSFLGTPDHQGGITLTWFEDSLFYALHLHADGTPAAGYSGGPRVLAIPPSPAQTTGHAFPIDEPFPGVGVCEGNGDGLIVTFVDTHGVVHARWYDGNGDPSPSPALYEVTSPSADIPALSGAAWFIANAAQSDGAGGAYVALQRSVADDIFSLRQDFVHITQTTVLATPPGPAPSHLALTAGPNPSRGVATLRLALPRDEIARVSLYDITGRVRFTREVTGAGEHVIALTDAGALEPGVYLARMTQGGTSATARVVVLF